ncbi:hypothetical protein EIP91_011854 [Steccherinum ochraceum]|uniref:RanBD1 domain-containing protein n=1 Tax=Steccherinum ochraceum TaxID=92696 RepID=A0A4V2MWX6_9APHY|nr:hypothetical protein EIP91_011854 [Steccherinum ochraceum]
MKRGAENQLTKDNSNFDDDAGGGNEPGRGLAKANEQVLAKREIRGLPKRSMGGAAAVPSVSTVLGKRAAPALASGVSNATKTFASFIASGGSSAKSQPPKPTESDSADKMDEDEDDEELKRTTEHFKALRGLNHSFISALNDAMSSDAFMDLTPYLDLYKSHREKEKKKYSEAINAIKNGSSSSSSSGSAPGTVKPPAAMPTPPTSFSGFGGFASSSAPSSSKPASSGSGFTYNPSAASSGTSSAFSLPTASTSTAKETAEPPKPAFAFGSSATSAPPPSLFGFGSSSATGSSNPFGSTSSSSPSVFGSNLFGAKPEAEKTTPSSSAGTLFGPGASAFGKPSASSSNSSGFPFGGTSTNSSTNSSTNGESSSLAGGSTAASTPPPFPGFGKTAGGTASSPFGNPVGFGFGSPSSTPSVNPFGAASSSSSFSQPPAINAKVKEEPSDTPGSSLAGSAVGSEEGTPAPGSDGDRDPASLLKHATSVHDQDGEGEQDETSEHQVRSKVYKMSKKDDGSQAWTDLGVGLLKVKKHSSTGTRRLLLRNSSTGKIVINFNIYTGMTPSVAKNTVSFVGHDNTEQAAVPGSATPFKLRVKTEGEAHELKDALDRAIEFVKSKSD